MRFGRVVFLLKTKLGATARLFVASSVSRGFAPRLLDGFVLSTLDLGAMLWVLTGVGGRVLAASFSIANSREVDAVEYFGWSVIERDTGLNRDAGLWVLDGSPKTLSSASRGE